MKENIILDVRHLQKRYKKYPVLKDVSFQIKQGHILGLIGKNGAGKTTLMKSVLGLNTNYQGEIIFHGKKLTPSDETMKAKIGSLVDVSFYDDMTAYQNEAAADRKAFDCSSRKVSGNCHSVCGFYSSHACHMYCLLLSVCCLFGDGYRNFCLYDGGTFFVGCLWDDRIADLDVSVIDRCCFFRRTVCESIYYVCFNDGGNELDLCASYLS
ncbi:hypothetical protein C817_05095 [Dorea sp. 5-2]|nr:hypothetical protein C817_05095 [Dorea sp. 5-2]